MFHLQPVLLLLSTGQYHIVSYPILSYPISLNHYGRSVREGKELTLLVTTSFSVPAETKTHLHTGFGSLIPLKTRGFCFSYLQMENLPSAGQRDYLHGPGNRAAAQAQGHLAYDRKDTEMQCFGKFELSLPDWRNITKMFLSLWNKSQGESYLIMVVRNHSLIPLVMKGQIKKKKFHFNYFFFYIQP